MAAIAQSGDQALRMVYRTALTYTNLVSAALASDLADLGSIRYAGGNWYKFIQDDGSIQLNALDPVAYVTYAAGFVGSKVTGTQANSSGIGAGVVQTTRPTLAAYYGWIQTKGLTTVGTITAGATGNALKYSGANKALTVVAAVTDAVIGVLVDSGTKTIFLDCQF